VLWKGWVCHGALMRIVGRAGCGAAGVAEFARKKTNAKGGSRSSRGVRFGNLWDCRESLGDAKVIVEGDRIS